MLWPLLQGGSTLPALFPHPRHRTHQHLQLVLCKDCVRCGYKKVEFAHVCDHSDPHNMSAPTNLPIFLVNKYIGQISRRGICWTQQPHSGHRGGCGWGFSIAWMSEPPRHCMGMHLYCGCEAGKNLQSIFRVYTIFNCHELLSQLGWFRGRFIWLVLTC